MANQVHVQNLRGNTAKNNNYLGVEGELVVNIESNSLRIHDGVKQGGHGTVYAASSETVVYAAMQDLAEGALVVVGTSKPYKLYQKIGDNLVMKDLEAEIDIHKGNVTTSGNTGDLGVRKIGDDYYIDATFPEATIVKGTVKTEGSEGKLEIVRNSVNNYTVNATFPEDEVYAAHSDSEEGSEELKELMPDGGIIIERTPGDKPILKQVVDGDLVATSLGGVQATYTADSDETDSIIDDVEEGALIVEGAGPINVKADIQLSATAGNTLERKTDGLFNPKSSARTANSVETDSVLPSLAEGALILEGSSDVISFETSAKVSAAAGNAIQRKVDGIFVESVKFGKTDPGVGSTLATGSIYLVYEE